MAGALTDYGRLYLADRAGFAARLGVPVLLWEAPKDVPPAGPRWGRTLSMGPATRPTARVPLVLEVRKDLVKKNPFAMGVTVGRVESNDVVIDDDSLSRFHGYFQLEPKSGRWVVVDAESKNGCYLDGVRLVPSQRAPVADGAQIRFGNVETRFLSPAGLAAHIERSLK